MRKTVAKHSRGFTSLEKFINSSFLIKADNIIQKVLFFKKSNSGVFLTGFTLAEILIVIAIISILASSYAITVKTSVFQKLKMDSEQLAADINYTRSLAISRAVYNGSYPGSYAIVFYNGCGQNMNSYYFIYAGNNRSNVIKRVTLSDRSFCLIDPNMSPFNINYRDSLSFTFVSESDISAGGFELSPNNEYQIAIMQPVSVTRGAYTFNTYNKFIISLGRISNDSYVWGGTSLAYDYVSPACGNGKIEREAGENCDLGDANSDNGACTESCLLNVCGDNKLYLGVEECDSSGVRTCPEPSEMEWCYKCGSGAVCDTRFVGGSCVSDWDGSCIWKSGRCALRCIM